MPENEERIGFEAYFETQEFEDGIKRWESGLASANKSGDSFVDKIINMRKSLDQIGGTLLGGIAGTAVGGPFGGAIGTAVGTIAGKLAHAFDPVSIALKGVSLLLKGVKGAFQLVGAVAQTAFKLVGVAIKGVMIGVTALTALVTGGLVAGFLLFRRTAQQAFTALTSKLKELLQTAVEFQQIEVGIHALVRSALVGAGTFETASDAIGAAIPIANELKEALEQLSLKSPFPTEYVYQIFRINAAFGIALDTSYKLTEAMLEIGAATGFSSTVLERISRNFAQVARNEKILERDITELSNAGLSMHRILDEELNMSVDEFNEGIKKGTVSMDDLYDALLRFTQKNYEGSFEALGMTVVGLQARFQNLGAVIVRDFVTPIVRMAAPALNTLMDALAMVTTTDVFVMFGQTVANMAQRVVGDIDWTTESIAQKIMDLLLWVAHAARDFFKWGYETFIAWGVGALKGAATAISAVANFISRALTRLFSTHSPPEILPMIDVWGAETIEAWLEGMTRADFSILNDIVDQVESVLKALDFENLDIGSILQTMVRDVSLGGLENIFASITDQLGPFADALQELVDLSNELSDENKILADIMKRVKDAMADVAREEEVLVGITKRYDAALKDVTAQEEILEGILDRKKTAMKDVTAQEKILESILDRRKDALKDVNTQEDILDGILDRKKIAMKDVISQEKILEAILDRKKIAMKDVNAQEDILDGILDRKKDAMKDVIAQENILEAILDRKKIAMKDVIAQEKILEAITDRMSDAQKALNKQEKILEDRTWAVKIAQEALEDAMDFYDDADDSVQRLVREYNALLRAGAGDDVLDAKLAEIKAMQLQRQEAAKLIDDTEDQVDVAEDAKFAQEQIIRGYKDAVDVIKEEADAQQEIIDGYQDIVDRIEEEADAQREVIDGYQDIVDAIEEEADAQREIIDGYQDIVDGIEDEADAQREVIDGYQDIVDGIEEEADAQREVIDGYQDIVDSINDEIDVQQEVIDGYRDIVNAIEEEADAQRDIIDNYQDIANGIQDEIDAQQEVIDGYQEIVDGIENEADAQRDAIDAMEDQISAQEDLIDLMLKLTGYTEDETTSLGDLNDELSDAEDNLRDIFDIDWEAIDTSALDSSLGDIGVALGEVETEWGTLVTAAEDAWADLTGENGPFSNAWEDIKALFNWNDQSSWDEFVGEMTPTVEHSMKYILFQNIKDLIIEFATNFFTDQEILNSIKDVGKNIIGNILDGVEEKSEAEDGRFKNMIVDFFIGKTRKALGIEGNTSKKANNEIGKPIADGIIGGIGDKLGDAGYKQSLIGFGDWIFDVIKGWLGISSPSQRAHDEIGVEITNGIINGIKEKFTNLTTTAGELWTTFKEGLGDFWTKAYDIGKAILQGMIHGINAKFSDLRAKAGEIWGTIKSGLGTVWNSAYSVGKDIIGGIMAGISSMPNLLGWASRIAGSIIQAIKNALNISSPSEEAEEEIGAPVAEGIFEGIDKGIKNSKVEFMMESPSKLMEEQVGVPLMQGVLQGFNTMKGAISEGMTSMLNYTPTPTQSYTPSSISNNSIVNNMYMGNNTVRSDIDIAIIENAVKRAIHNASFGI